MKTYIAYAETTILLYNADDDLIGEDSGHHMVYELKAPNMSSALRAGRKRWSYTGNSSGTHGATWFGDYDYSDVYDEVVIVDEIFDIEEFDE